MAAAPTSTFRLVLWPSIVTLLISIARLVGEREGWMPTASGGSFAWLGISWFGFAMGVWFGWRLRRGGDGPRIGKAWAWSLLTLLVFVGTAAWQLADISRTDSSAAALVPLRAAVLAIVAVAVPLALLQFVIWPRLAWTLLAYAIPARITVFFIAWYAKSQEWDSHYTKFGPAGILRDLPGTLESAAISQLGFWVPLTMVIGTVLGCITFGRARQPAG